MTRDQNHAGQSFTSFWTAPVRVSTEGLRRLFPEDVRRELAVCQIIQDVEH